MRSGLVVVVLFSPIYGVDSQRYDIDDNLSHVVDYRSQQINNVGDLCVEQNGGTSLGEEWLKCVMTELNHRKEDEEEKDGSFGPFPVPQYELNPLTIHGQRSEGEDRINHGLLLLDLLRNYTCTRTQDGGSIPVQIEEWVYDERSNMQEAYSKRQSCPSEESNTNKYLKIAGYLPAGNDLVNPSGPSSLQDSMKWCDETPECTGFTFENGSDKFYFKSNFQARHVNVHNSWTSYVRRSMPSHCSSTEYNNNNSPQRQQQEDYYAPQKYQVKVLRREPLVIVVPNFLTEEDCNALIDAGGSEEKMGAAHEAGGPSSYRKSYSSNINIDYDNRTSVLTRISEKQYALVRDLTGYDVHGNLGQEPLNAVLYKNIGDEYRPHCDGPCNGGLYPHGSRLATSIVYCRTADGGSGQTSFTRSGMMVSPKQYDFLLFAYRYENFTMDNGYTEHSGCPISGGKKWIGTQWYREGVEDDISWNIIDDIHDM